MNAQLVGVSNIMKITTWNPRSKK